MIKDLKMSVIEDPGLNKQQIVNIMNCITIERPRHRGSGDKVQ
jgi:hypothetical protein